MENELKLVIGSQVSPVTVDDFVIKFETYIRENSKFSFPIAAADIRENLPPKEIIEQCKDKIYIAPNKGVSMHLVSKKLTEDDRNCLERNEVGFNLDEHYVMLVESYFIQTYMNNIHLEFAKEYPNVDCILIRNTITKNKKTNEFNSFYIVYYGTEIVNPNDKNKKILRVRNQYLSVDGTVADLEGFLEERLSATIDSGHGYLLDHPEHHLANSGITDYFTLTTEIHNSIEYKLFKQNSGKLN